MKSVIFALSFLTALQAMAANSIDCRNLTGASDELSIEAVNDDHVRLTLVNASGVEDASGVLKCTGPMEAAYGCDGKLTRLDSKKATINARLVIAEGTLQNGGAGPVQYNDVRYQCVPHKN